MTPIEEVEILRACCCVAGADGNCTENERAILQRLADNVGVGKASFDAMLERGMTDPDFHKKQFQILKSQPEMTMETLLTVAVADENVSVAEATVLKNLAANLDIGPEKFDEIVQRVVQNRQP